VSEFDKFVESGKNPTLNLYIVSLLFSSQFAFLSYVQLLSRYELLAQKYPWVVDHILQVGISGLCSLYH
jgi:hypothetical protein